MMNRATMWKTFSVCVIVVTGISFYVVNLWAAEATVQRIATIIHWSLRTAVPVRDWNSSRINRSTQSFDTFWTVSPAYPGFELMQTEDNIQIRAWENCTCDCTNGPGLGSCGNPVGIFTPGPARQVCVDPDT